MPPLTQEQFQKARASGLSTEKIIEFEKRRLSETPEETKPKTPISAFLGKTPLSLEKSGKWVQSGLLKTGEDIYREGVSPILSGGSTFALGIPKAIASKTGTKELIYPEQETLGGKTLRFGAETAGFMSGAGLKAGKFVAGKIFPQVASKLTLGASKGARSFLTKQAIRNSLRTGTELGTAGFLQTSENDFVDLTGRTLRAGIGGILGTTGGLVGEKVKGVAKGFRKFNIKYPRVLPEEEKELFKILSPQKKVAYQIRKAGDIFGQKSSTLKAQADLEAKTLEDNTAEAIRVLKENKKTMLGNLKQDAERKTLTTQEKLPEFYKNQTDAYEKIRDEISQKLIDSGEQITLQEATNIFRATVSELDDRLITGVGRDAIEQIYNEYMLIGKTFSPNQSVNFKLFLKDLKIVKDTISETARAGTKRFAEEDIAGAVLSKNYGEFFKTRIPEFAELQKDYSQIVDAMDLSNKVFKPYRGELYTNEGRALLQRFGLMKEGEENATTRLLQKIEKGGKLGAGTGDITSTLKESGKEIQNIALKIQNIEMSSKQILAKNEDVYLKNKASIDKELEKRLGQLTLRELKMAQVNTNQQKILAIMKTLGWIGGIVSGGYALGRISGEITDILRR